MFHLVHHWKLFKMSSNAKWTRGVNYCDKVAWLRAVFATRVKNKMNKYFNTKSVSTNSHKTIIRSQNAHSFEDALKIKLFQNCFGKFHHFSVRSNSCCSESILQTEGEIHIQESCRRNILFIAWWAWAVLWLCIFWLDTYNILFSYCSISQVLLFI